ncbi:MAG: hypothetical protein AAFZ65_05560 [Planctomycetota bacterium]
MSLAAWLALAVGGALVTDLLRRLAPALGWLDPRPGSRLEGRKAQVRAAAPVGGAVLVLVALPAALGLEQVDGRGALAIAAAVAVGAVDDGLRDGLGPRTKVLLQVALAGLVAWAAPDAALAFIVALVAMNAINTFDNSDGSSASVSALGLALGAPAASAVLLGFLPQNLRRGRRAQAYLGDSGSHALGVWIALEPTAWPVLLVPLLDLARTVRRRVRVGRKPWEGDRRHLAHDLERAGWRSPGRVAAFVAAAAPSWAGAASGGALWAGLGGAASLGGVALLARCGVPADEEPEAVRAG